MSKHTLVSQLEQLTGTAKRRNHRACLVISGQQTWVDRQLENVRGTLGSAIVITSQAPSEGWPWCTEHDRLIDPKSYRSVLGSEAELLIWDGFSSLHPDAFAACSGILNGGGLFILLIPPSEQFESSQDASYREMLDEDTKAHESTLFKQRFLNKLQNLDLSLYVEQDKPVQLQCNADQCVDQRRSSKTQGIQLNQDQQQVITAIEHLATGHRRRPIVVTADRGRGKSTALGIGLANIVNANPEHRVIVPRSAKESIDVLLSNFKNHVDAAYQDHLEIVAPDALVNSKLDCHLVAVDEAAALPLPMLEKVAESYPRVIFSSTQHGYEGSGRGFDLKLDTLLARHCDRVQRLSLSEPTRWNPEDPFEQFVFDTFALDADLGDIPSAIENPEFRWLEQRTLYENEGLLKQVFSLFVLAHYQTRPSDLRLLLDHPRIRVGVIETGSKQNRLVCGAILCMSEGGIGKGTPDDVKNELITGIIAGNRRIRGHLVAQALSQQQLDPEWMTEASLRVVRIVVHPESRRHGLGTRLLAEATALASSRAHHALTVSFGVERSLLGFWKQQNFFAMKLGYMADASSGVPSVMMAKPIQENRKAHLMKEHIRFIAHLINGASMFYQSLPADIFIELLQHQANSNKQARVKLKASELDRLKLVAHQNYPIYDAWPELQQLFLVASMQGQIDTDDPFTIACLEYCLMGKNQKELVSKAQVRGKKEWDQKLRNLVGDLVENEA